MTAETKRAQLWADTMNGFAGESKVVDAHSNSTLRIVPSLDNDRLQRELDECDFNPGAAKSVGSGRRQVFEEADTWRTCFEKDRDRILHCAAFRRLAGKTQVFIFPKDHQRTRLTHALEVSQVARAIAKRLGLNPELTEAIALGHDCGHGPGGHASEDALSQFLPQGYDHAVVGADRVLAPLNLCSETLDGIRNHSWSRPEPGTAEGLVVSWADRIAYCAHDLEDAVGARIVSRADVPEQVRELAGETRPKQLNYFINSVVNCALATGKIAMFREPAEVLGRLREFNYQAIYLRPESVKQSKQVISILQALVEYLISRPKQTHDLLDLPGALESDQLLLEVVSYVGGMTDRYAFSMAQEFLHIDRYSIPDGVGFGAQDF